MKTVSIVKSLGMLLVLAGVIILATIQYRNSVNADKHLVFSDKTMLSALYADYKQEYWETATGRTIDREQDDITTSHAQSYTMMRAVWMGDRQTFDKTWTWTADTLQQPDTKLFALKWGMLDDKTYGILKNEGGNNTAADADVDIAFALLMAAGRWEQQKYIDAAREIIPAIWEQEVISVSGKPYLASNNLDKFSGRDPVMNPSYIAPYAFREFAKIDQSHDWNALVDSSYALLEYSMDSTLAKPSTAWLPPDWFVMGRISGALRTSDDAALTTNYGPEAARVPWRLALDHTWHAEPRAKRLLEKMTFLGDQWKSAGKLSAVYSHDGTVISDAEVPAMYGGSLGYFAVVDRSTGQLIYDDKLKKLYNQNENSWAPGVGFYDDNWAWFGLALFDRQLDNPAANLTYKDS